MQRLETQYETRQTGWQINKTTGLPQPVHTTFHIGHGAQLARTRLADRALELSTRHDGQIDDITRQQARRLGLKERKRAEKIAAKVQAAADLKAFREEVAPIREAKAKRRAAIVASRRKPHPHGDLKHMHRAARAGALLRATLEAAKPARKSRAKTATA